MPKSKLREICSSALQSLSRLDEVRRGRQCRNWQLDFQPHMLTLVEAFEQAGSLLHQPPSGDGLLAMWLRWLASVADETENSWNAFAQAHRADRDMWLFQSEPYDRLVLDCGPTGRAVVSYAAGGTHSPFARFTQPMPQQSAVADLLDLADEMEQAWQSHGYYPARPNGLVRQDRLEAERKDIERQFENYHRDVMVRFLSLLNEADCAVDPLLDEVVMRHWSVEFPQSMLKPILRSWLPARSPNFGQVGRLQQLQCEPPPRDPNDKPYFDDGVRLARCVREMVELLSGDRDGGEASLVAKQLPVSSEPASGSSVVVEQKDWFDHDPPEDSKYKYGPLVGTLAHLSGCIGMDRRTLRNHNGTGGCWIRKIHNTKFAAWFSSQRAYSEANGKHLETQQRKS